MFLNRDIWNMYFMTWLLWLMFALLSVLFHEKKIIEAYYGFRVLYVFPFPSAGHWPLVFGSWHIHSQFSHISLFSKSLPLSIFILVFLPLPWLLKRKILPNFPPPQKRREKKDQPKKNPPISYSNSEIKERVSNLPKEELFL